MSKAEDLSKQYKDFREQCGIKDPVMLNEIEEAYYKGYNQAKEAVEIARGKMIEKVCMYLNEHRNGVIDDEYIINLNKAMKDE